MREFKMDEEKKRSIATDHEPTQYLLNDFALRSFRDIADGDYIVARAACRASLASQYLWATQQMIEKYLKCILLLHRIPAANVKHDLGAAVDCIESSGKLKLGLTTATKEFLRRIDREGQFRYLEVSNFGQSRDLVAIDRTAWELRRFCTLDTSVAKVVLRNGYAAPRVSLPGGLLESIMADKKQPAREPLLWHNGFFGPRIRKTVKLRGWWQATNSPLSLHPELLSEVRKYVYLPKKVIQAYEEMRGK